MVVRVDARHDRFVLAPSWPPVDRVRRRLTSPQVRRRVDAALRRAMRRAVLGWGGLILVGIALDMMHSILVLGPAGRQMATYQVGELFAIGLAMWVAVRRLQVAEPLTLAMLLVSHGMWLVRLWLLPETAILSLGFLITTLAGSGMFLPWTSRWQAAWLVGAIVLTALTAAAVPGVAAGFGGPTLLVAAVVLAALASFFGHRTWQVRLGDMLEQQFALRELSRYARRQEAHVTALNAELNRVARRDALTGVGNRLALDEALARLLEDRERLRPERFAIVLFDIDHFKAYNDAHGHLVGDAALSRLGETLRRAVRGTDRAFRYGGEEFLLVLPGVELPGAMEIGERVRLAVAEDRDPSVPPFTVSGGVALCDPADGRDPAPLLRRADVALYRAKRQGRNRVAADELSVAMQRDELAGLNREELAPTG